jgi:DNA replication protein DnaC
MNVDFDQVLKDLQALPVVSEERLAEQQEDSRQARSARLREEAGLSKRAVRTLGDRGSPSAAAPQANHPTLNGWQQALERVRVRFGEKTGATIGLIGAEGTGKTVLATALALEWTAQLRSVRYSSLLRLLLALEAGRNGSGPSRFELLEELAGVSLLILDECDKGFGSEAEKRTVFELLDQRHAACRDTLLISHPPVEQFKAWLGPELMDRMNETGGLVECNWKGMRL